MIKEFVIISTYSVFVPILLGMIQLRKTNNYLVLLFILVVFSFLIDFITLYNPSLRTFLYTTYDILQYVIILFIFLSQSKIKIIRKAYFSVFSILIIYSLIFLFYDSIFNFRIPDLQTVSMFAIILASLLFYINIYETLPDSNLFKYPLFWLNSGLLLYFCGNLFLFVSFNYYSSDQLYQLYYPIHNSLNALKNLFFGIAFLTQFIYHKKTSVVSHNE